MSISAKPDYHSKLAAKYKAILDVGHPYLSFINQRTHPLLCHLQKACQASVASGDSPLDSVDSPTLIAAEPVPTKAAPVPTIANILPRPELPPPISKASGVSRAAPQPQYCDGRVGSGLGHALMAHASATGGIGGAKSMRAKKLDFDFDFDEAIEEATAPSSGMLNKTKTRFSMWLQRLSEFFFVTICTSLYSLGLHLYMINQWMSLFFLITFSWAHSNRLLFPNHWSQDMFSYCQQCLYRCHYWTLSYWSSALTTTTATNTRRQWSCRELEIFKCESNFISWLVRGVGSRLLRDAQNLWLNSL